MRSALVLLLVGCAAQPGGPVGPGGGGGVGGTGGGAEGLAGGGGTAATGGGSATGGGGEVPDAGPGVDVCLLNERLCTSHVARTACVQTAQGTRWQGSPCASGSGCVQGDCVAQRCSDGCNLGEVNDAGVSCRLYDVATGAAPALDAAGKTHDRARDYNRWLRRDGLVSGGVGSAVYSDPPVYSHANITTVNGIGDSAIWTGTYLAAEALRLQATGSADARANVRRLASTLHLWFNVSGQPGYLARWAQPAGTLRSYVIPDYDCTNRRVHCNVMYQGKAYDYIGHISRDQYQGVMLGYALAFDALRQSDSDVKDFIRADTVTLVKELMRERMVPMSVKLNGTRLPASTVSARFIVVNPAEMVNGALDLQLDLGGPGDGEMWGFQEFAPDVSMLVRELPGLSWVPPIERASSAIMLASFFNVAMAMTANDPRFAADHQLIRSYYLTHMGKGGNIGHWLTIAKKWSPATGCNQTYYANNITFEPLYNLSRLETDPGRRNDIQNVLFTGKMWPVFSTTKNPFFSFIYAGTVAGAPAQVVTAAVSQLAQFPPPPRVHLPVDLRNDSRYPRDDQCPDQLRHDMAVDVGERVVSDFIWQRDPWQLFAGGDPHVTEPGVDYLAAYWLGRKHGFITDDTPGRCLAFH